MLEKKAVWQLATLVVIAVAVCAYAGANYARVDKLFGIGVYTVHADFPDSGGIFVNAEVTYLGYPVGRVKALQLHPGGVRVDLTMDSDKPRIPASAQAVVVNRSAIGEQYVDLRPASVGGPYLSTGSVITATAIPLPVQDVIASAVDFTTSIPLDDLRTLVTELGRAFDNNSENLRTLIDALTTLTRTGNDNLPATISLIQHSNTVLTTQAAQADAIGDWSRSLNLIAAQLATSDPDVRRLLTTGRTSASELSSLLQRSSADITTALRNVVRDVRNVSGGFDGIGPALSTLALISSVSYSAAPGDGTIRFGTVLETNNPPSCTRGYESTRQIIADEKRRNPAFDINYDEYPFNTDARCAVAQGNPTDVRGAQNARFADPATPAPWDRTPKKAPDTLELNPIATQLATLLGVIPPQKKTR